MAGNFLSSGVYAAFTLCILASFAQAQSTEAESSTQTNYQKILDTISVTATRNPTKSFAYPGMVSVIGHSEIQDPSALTPDDVLKFVQMSSSLAVRDGPVRSRASAASLGRTSSYFRRCTAKLRFSARRSVLHRSEPAQAG